MHRASSPAHGLAELRRLHLATKTEHGPALQRPQPRLRRRPPRTSVTGCRPPWQAREEKYDIAREERDRKVALLRDIPDGTKIGTVDEFMFKEGVKDILEKLDYDLIGLGPVKQRVREIASLLARASEFLPLTEPNHQPNPRSGGAQRHTRRRVCSARARSGIPA